MTWPENVIYTTKLVWDPKITSQQRKDMESKINPTDYKLVNKKKKGQYCVKQIQTVGHPACNQYGLFAKQTIKPDSWIIDYFGYVTLNYDKTSDYVLKYIGELSIDAAKYGNEARMVNDYRGILKKPNAQFLLYRDVQSGTFRMGVFSMPKVDIKKGEEICVTYGKAFWKARQGIVPNI